MVDPDGPDEQVMRAAFGHPAGIQVRPVQGNDP
jgi:hypothetical protein